MRTPLTLKASIQALQITTQQRKIQLKRNHNNTKKKKERERYEETVPFVISITNNCTSKKSVKLTGCIQL